MDLFKCAHNWDNRQWACAGVLSSGKMPMNSFTYIRTSVHCECVVAANGCIMVALSNYPTSLHCCCCTIHLVFQSTTDKHCEFKKELQMRISHYNNSVPCERSSQKTRLNLAAGWTMLRLSFPVRVSHADCSCFGYCEGTTG